jgi:hypothetical protein
MVMACWGGGFVKARARACGSSQSGEQRAGARVDGGLERGRQQAGDAEMDDAAEDNEGSRGGRMEERGGRESRLGRGGRLLGWV